MGSIVRTIRIYQAGCYVPGETLCLSDAVGHHIATVLRLKPGKTIQLFNGQGQSCLANILDCKKREVRVEIQAHIEEHPESPLRIHLGQSISKGERMEWAIQKAVELGVQDITPILSTFCAVKRDTQRLTKKCEQWQTIAIHACEQSGRTHIPTIHPALAYTDWLQNVSKYSLRIILDPEGNQRLTDLDTEVDSTALVIGPEGGFSDEELHQAEQHDFLRLRLGPRVLRTETASLVALSLLQGKLGDL